MGSLGDGLNSWIPLSVSGVQTHLFWMFESLELCLPALQCQHIHNNMFLLTRGISTSFSIEGVSIVNRAAYWRRATLLCVTWGQYCPQCALPRHIFFVLGINKEANYTSYWCHVYGKYCWMWYETPNRSWHPCHCAFTYSISNWPTEYNISHKSVTKISIRYPSNIVNLYFGY